MKTTPIEIDRGTEVNEETVKLHAELMDVPARVDCIVHLRTMVLDGCVDTAVEDFFDLLDDEDIPALWPDMHKDDYESFLFRLWDDVGILIEERKLFGFLVRLSTPVVNKTGGYSWGWYTSKAFYADTFDDAVRAGLDWARAEHEKGAK